MSQSPRMAKTPQRLSIESQYNGAIAWVRWASRWTFTLWAAALVTQFYNRPWEWPLRRVLAKVVKATIMIAISVYYLDGVLAWDLDHIREIRTMARCAFYLCFTVSVVLRLPHIRRGLALPLRTARWKFWSSIALIATLLLTRLVDGVWGLVLEPKRS